MGRTRYGPRPLFGLSRLGVSRLLPACVMRVVVASEGITRPDVTDWPPGTHRWRNGDRHSVTMSVRIPAAGGYRSPAVRAVSVDVALCAASRHRRRSRGRGGRNGCAVRTAAPDSAPHSPALASLSADTPRGAGHVHDRSVIPVLRDCACPKCCRQKNNCPADGRPHPAGQRSAARPAVSGRGLAGSGPDRS